jgi:adenylate cyclase
MLRFHVSDKRERQQFEHASGPIEFGRGPKRNNVARCVIEDLRVSRDHVRVEELENGRVRVENLSTRNPIRLADNSIISPGDRRELELPLRLAVIDTLIEIEPAGADPIRGELLETIAQPFRSRSVPDVNQSLPRLGGSPTPETLAHWFETVIAVQRAAAGSPEFYDQTARAVVDLVGLDRGMVLLRRGATWEVAARTARENGGKPEFSHTLLRYVIEQRRTFYLSSASASTIDSLRGVEAVVASPIFDSQDQVVGAVYGCRTRSAGPRGTGVGPLEAQVVQLLASAVGIGLARQEQEAEASRLRVQFEQFFSANLARELQRNPRLLEGQEREVTVLFSDIRGFSRLAERLGPHDTCRLVADVMERLTARIREFDGVVVDYTGDGLMAMWNAPAAQPDHAARACRAALAMLNELPSLSADWQEMLSGPLAIGVGLNTGPALVGNTGSRHKFKYGPLGHTVNLASRVEGATKQLGIPALITGSTKALLGDRFATRRLCRVRVVGVSGAVDLYELHAESASPEWLARRDAYESGLAQFETGQWAAACRAIYPLLAGQEGNYDIAALDLIARSIECLKSKPKAFDAVLDLSIK